MELVNLSEYFAQNIKSRQHGVKCHLICMTVKSIITIIMRQFHALIQLKFLCCLALAVLSGSPLRAQFNQNAAHLLSPEYEAEAGRLRVAAPQHDSVATGALADSVSAIVQSLEECVEAAS